MQEMKLVVDGETVPLNDFVRSFIGQTIRGSLSALNDVDPQGSIEIYIPKGKDRGKSLKG